MKSLRSISIIVSFAAVLLMTATALAQSPVTYNVGDEVEVRMFNEWLPGRVVRVHNDRAVEVEYERRGARQRFSFPLTHVRHKDVPEVPSPMRTWRDNSGRFEVQAELLKVGENSITLRTDDDREIEVPIDRLSREDQSYVQDIQQGAGRTPATGTEAGRVSVPELPRLSNFSRRDATTAPSFLNIERDSEELSELVFERFHAKVSVPPDPQDSPPVTQSGVWVHTHRERVGALIPVGGDEQWILAGLEPNFPQSALSARLLWISLADQTIAATHYMPSGEMILDHHAPSGQLATLDTQRDLLGNNRTTRVTIWKTGPENDQLQPVISWDATLNRWLGDRRDHWARFASDRILIVCDPGKNIGAWDIVDRKLLWAAGDSHTKPALSPGGRYAYYTAMNDVRVLDATTGEFLGCITANSPFRAVASHPDGRTLAALTLGELFIVDITGEEPPRRFSTSAFGEPVEGSFTWLSDDLLYAELLHNEAVVFSLQHGIPVWRYKLDTGTMRMGGLGRSRAAVGGHLLYSAAMREPLGRSPREGGRDGLVIGAVELPGPAALEAMRNFRREDHRVIGPGSTVMIWMEAVAEGDRIRAAVEKAVERAGWQIVERGSNNILRVVLSRGPTQFVPYESRDVRDFGRSGRTETVEFAPYRSTVELFMGSRLLWRNQKQDEVPGAFFLSEGQTLQEEIDKWQSPNVTFFDRLRLPEEILDNRLQEGLGQSTITVQGIIDATGSE